MLQEAIENRLEDITIIIGIVSIFNVGIGTCVINFMIRLDRRILYLENYLREPIFVRRENRAIVV
jgi:hypothetical protein